MVVEWLKRRIREAGAYRESDTERDGFLSYSWEYHAVGHGLYKGITTSPLRHPPEPDREDVDAESHYYRGAYVFATSAQWGAMGLLAYLGYEHVLYGVFLV